MKKIIPFLAALSLPGIAFAQNFTTFTNIATTVSHIIGLLIPAAFGLAVLYFFYGIAKYVLAAGDEAAAKKGKSIMIYGVIAMAVMASVWCITLWLQNIFGINNTSTVQAPGFTAPTTGGLQ